MVRSILTGLKNPRFVTEVEDMKYWFEGTAVNSFRIRPIFTEGYEPCEKLWISSPKTVLTFETVSLEVEQPVKIATKSKDVKIIIFMVWY